MPEQIQKITSNVKSRWDALEKRQKIRLVAAVLIVLLALGLTIYFTVRVRYRPFANNLDPQTFRNMETALTNAGIKYRAANNSTSIWVDEDEIGTAEIETALDPSLAGSVFTFADAVSASGMSSTETVKRAALLRATQTDLETDLMGFNDISYASVKLVIPDRTRLITRTDEKSSASVTISSDTRELTGNDGSTVARFICRGVDGLEMENIEVINADDMSTLYSGMEEAANQGVGAIADLQEQERNVLIRQVRALFPFYDEVQIAPNLVYDSTIASEQRNSTYAVPVDGNETGVPLTETSRSSEASGTPNADEPGLGTNDQATNDYATGGDNTYEASEEELTRNFGYNQTETVTSTGPTGYRRDVSTITLALIRYVAHDQASLMARNENYTQTDWEDFKAATAERVVEDDPNLEAYTAQVVSATGLDAENVTVTITEVPVFNDFTETPVEIQQIIMFAVLALLILMLAIGLLRRTKPEEEGEEIEPELSVEDLLVSTQLEEAKEESEKLEEIDYFKDSEIKRMIEKFVNEKPEAVAQLLRNWLNAVEEW